MTILNNSELPSTSFGNELLPIFQTMRGYYTDQAVAPVIQEESDSTETATSDPFYIEICGSCETGVTEFIGTGLVITMTFAFLFFTFGLSEYLKNRTRIKKSQR